MPTKNRWDSFFKKRIMKNIFFFYYSRAFCLSGVESMGASGGCVAIDR